VFGIGWGLSGFCPGPALVGFGAGYDKAAVFVVAMVVGMLLYWYTDRWSDLATDAARAAGGK
jgi:uncharacterized membrane protein YedE/YeeE